jgi:hypothetical protein
MSALPPKADMFIVEIDVRFMPRADLLREEIVFIAFWNCRYKRVANRDPS